MGQARGRGQGRAAVHELADLVIGQEPLRVEDNWQVLRRGGFCGAEVGHAWRSPVWRHDDGGFAEW